MQISEAEITPHAEKIDDVVQKRIHLVIERWKKMSAEERKNTGAQTPGLMWSFTMGVVGSLKWIVARNAAGIERIEKRVAELEARPEMKYCGVFEPNTTYRRGEFVTHKGSLWHCWERTTDVPGATNAWQLAVKRGADGQGGGR